MLCFFLSLLFCREKEAETNTAAPGNPGAAFLFAATCNLAANVYTFRGSKPLSIQSPMTEKRRKTAQVNLRIHPKLKAAAEKAAADDNRSLTSLIEKLLMDYLKKQRRG